MTFQTPQKSKKKFFDTPSAKQIQSMSRQEKIDLLNQLNGGDVSLPASRFDSPGKGGLRRPNTGMSSRSNASRKSNKSSARKTAKKPAPIRNLCDLVKKSDRMNHELVIDYLQSLIQCQQRLQDPLDDIETIFNKIQAWKQKFGDLDQQEKGVTKALRQTDLNKVEIHNAKTLIGKLYELQDAIGLTDDEISIIVYTSIDHDNFTNLIVLAGEFMLWFNLNFEGESREEIDFRENKCENWVATCELAKLVIDSYSVME